MATYLPVENFIENFTYNDKGEVINVSTLCPSYLYSWDWDGICRDKKLSIEFMRKHKEQVNWQCISIYQKLSEEAIREFHYYFDWKYVFKYQNLSEQLIRDFRNKLGAYNISRHQKLSNKFRKELQFNKPYCNWMNNSVSNKLRYIKKNGIDRVYPLDKDKNGYFLIAYKSVNTNGTSRTNLQYVYEIGKTYESWCDCNLFDENSFGLSAWTKEGALNFYSGGKLLLVKIYLKDLGAIVHKGHKLRAFKMTILEEVKK
jgi:hypothetical protein